MFLKDHRWNETGNTIIAGPSFSGKTTILNNIVTRKDFLIVNGKAKSVILFYLSDQEIYREWERSGLLSFKSRGVPDLESFKETISIYGKEGAVVIFDDLGSDLRQNAKFFKELFLVLSHHLKLNVFLVLHNIFPDGLRELSLNAHRFIITHNPRDALSISTLARQCFPGSKDFLPNVYKFIGEREFGYLILDFHQTTNPALRVSTNWFFETGPYIMAFQSTGSCSTAPYKCLHVISSDLYNSLLSNSRKCGDKTAASSSNSSSYAAPSIHNNFYPTNSFDFKSDSDSKTPAADNHSDSANLPPDDPPKPPDLPPTPPSPDDTPDNFTHPVSPNGVLTQTSSEISSNQNPKADEGEAEFNGVVSGAGDQILPPPIPNAIKSLRRKTLFKKKPDKKRKAPSRPSARDPPLPPPQIPPQKFDHEIPVAQSAPKDEAMDHEPSSTSVSPKVEAKDPLSKFKGKVKWPTFEERKPDIKPYIKKPTKTVEKKEPLVKRKPKFERNLPEDMDVEDDEPKFVPSTKPIATPRADPKWPSYDERKTDKKFGVKKLDIGSNASIKKPLVKRKPKFERNLPDIAEDEEDLPKVVPREDLKPKIKDETKWHKQIPHKKPLLKPPVKPLEIGNWIRTAREIDVKDDSRDTHQNELKMRFNAGVHIDQVRERKYPQIKKAEKVPKVEKKISFKNPNDLKHKYKIKTVAKGPIRVREDLFIDAKEKVKDRMRVSMFKANNGSEKKSSKMNKSNIMNAPKKEDEHNDVEFIEIPYMPEHAAGAENKTKNAPVRKSISFQTKKRTIENHSNPTVARGLKSEMIEDMQHETTSSKRKNNFPTHPTGPIKFLRTKEAQKGKRKNNFGTHPTGPIKFVKSKHEKGKNEDEKDEEAETKKRMKKVYGSGFKLWKF